MLIKKIIIITISLLFLFVFLQSQNFEQIFIENMVTQKNYIEKYKIRKVYSKNNIPINNTAIIYSFSFNFNIDYSNACEIFDTLSFRIMFKYLTVKKWNLEDLIFYNYSSNSLINVLNRTPNFLEINAIKFNIDYANYHFITLHPNLYKNYFPYQFAIKFKADFLFIIGDISSNNVFIIKNENIYLLSNVILNSEHLKVGNDYFLYEINFLENGLIKKFSACE